MKVVNEIVFTELVASPEQPGDVEDDIFTVHVAGEDQCQLWYQSCRGEGLPQSRGVRQTTQCSSEL